MKEFKYFISRSSKIEARTQCIVRIYWSFHGEEPAKNFKKNLVTSSIDEE